MIHRAEHNEKEPYAVISRKIFEDDRLSFEARGFLCYLLMFSDEWSFNVQGLASLTGKCVNTIVRLTGELKDAGYLEQKRGRSKKGTFESVEWDVYEIPRSTFSKHGKNQTRQTPNTVSPNMESTIYGEPQTNNKYQSITSNNNNKYETKRVYGEFSNVLLTPEQFNKLGEQFGTLQRDLVLEELSGYITEHPKKYKDHYITLRNWLLKRKGEQKAQPAPAQTVGVDWAKYYAIADRVERGNR